MLITCDQCGRALELPDEKVPNRRFSIACPSCQHKIAVDPTAAAGQPAAPQPATPQPAAPQPATPQPATPQPAAPQPAPAPGDEALDTDVPGAVLRQLRGVDRELMEVIPQTAVVVHYDVPPDPRITAEIKRLGLKDVQPADSIEAGCDFVEDNEISLLLVRMAKASAPPCEPLRPIYNLPFDQRRSTFVALVADNVKTLDGQVAFYLQVNCLVAADDIPTLAPKLQRALLHHLRLYRHWARDV